LSGRYLPTWYARRQGGGLGSQEQAAARKTAVHAGTRTVTHFDALGHALLTVTHNATRRSTDPSVDARVEELHASRVIHDVEGN
jgi:hypothetical protein